MMAKDYKELTYKQFEELADKHARLNVERHCRYARERDEKVLAKLLYMPGEEASVRYKRYEILVITDARVVKFDQYGEHNDLVIDDFATLKKYWEVDNE